MKTIILNILAGIWLIIAPFVLGYSSLPTAQWNDIVLGAVIAVLAIWGFFSRSMTGLVSWISVALGFWLIIAPFVLGYSLPAPRLNDIILGIVVIVISTWNATAEEEKK